MRPLLALLLLACSSSAPPRDTTSGQALSPRPTLDLRALAANPAGHEWLDFRPNVKKLIFAGSAETEHVAILWYTVPDGRVGLHRHTRTESVYVIDGRQSDGKGTYAKGTVYFNPPGSGHELSDSSGLFLLAYAAPPDFANTSALVEYTPVRLDTTDPALWSAAAPAALDSGVRTLDIPLDRSGGMSGRLIELGATDRYQFAGTYLLVVEGTCQLPEGALAEQSLVVASGVKPELFELAGGPCRLLGVSF